MENESVDLIYLDPPFNSKHNYAAPIGSKAAGAEFKDTWTLSDIDQAWWGEIADQNESLYSIIGTSGKTGGNSTMSYLIYMAIRILEMHRILKSTGSLYLHCDPTMSHYVKLMLDAIFYSQNFKNEIVWKRATSGQKGSQHKSKKFGGNHDIILFYCKNRKYAVFDIPKKFPINDEIEKKFPKIDPDGRRWKDDSAHIWRTPNMGDRPNLCYTWNGFKNPHSSGWRLSKDRLDEEYAKGNFEIIEKDDGTKKLIRKVYQADYKGESIGDLWDDIDPVQGNEQLGYPTQKPLALLERIIESSSVVGEVVFDPFCGCATACLAAERLGRRWIGCDISERAYSLIKSRLQADAGIAKFITGAGQVIHRIDVPKRTSQRSRNIKHTLYGIQHGYCNGCKYHYQFKDLEVDHIIPTSKGGQDDDKNLQLLCGNCNRRKGGKLTMAELIALLKSEGLKLGHGKSE